MAAAVISGESSAGAITVWVKGDDGKFHRSGTERFNETESKLNSEAGLVELEELGNVGQLEATEPDTPALEPGMQSAKRARIAAPDELTEYQKVVKHCLEHYDFRVDADSREKSLFLANWFYETIQESVPKERFWADLGISQNEPEGLEGGTTQVPIEPMSTPASEPDLSSFDLATELEEVRELVFACKRKRVSTASWPGDLKRRVVALGQRLVDSRLPGDSPLRVQTELCRDLGISFQKLADWTTEVSSPNAERQIVRRQTKRKHLKNAPGHRINTVIFDPYGLLQQAEQICKLRSGVFEQDAASLKRAVELCEENSKKQVMPNRRFTPFIVDAAGALLSNHRDHIREIPHKRLANLLGVHPSTLRRWLIKCQSAATPALNNPGHSSEAL